MDIYRASVAVVDPGEAGKSYSLHYTDGQLGLLARSTC